MRSKLENSIDAKFEKMGVKPYVYHVMEYERNGRTKILDMFEGITVVLERHEGAKEIADLIGKLDYECEHGALWADPDNPEIVSPATWMIERLKNFGIHGIAVCDWRDQFSRKRGRIIAKGRLFKYLMEA